MTLSGCHQQAATRELMLQQNRRQHHQKYFRKFSRFAITQPNESQNGRQQQQPQAHSTSLSSQGDQQRDIEQQATSASTNGPFVVQQVTNSRPTEGQISEHHQQTTHGGTASNDQQANREHRDSFSDDQSSASPPPNYHEIPGIVPSYHGRTSGPPPAYDDVVNPNAAPPSYQSLFGQVREARKSSNSLLDLLRQLFLVLIGTIGCTMIIGFLLLIPITMIFVGLFYIHDCKAENIPSFLVIGGFVWIVKNTLNCYNQFKKDSSTLNRPPPRRAPIATVAQQPAQSTAVDVASSSTATTVSIVSSSMSTQLPQPQATISTQMRPTTAPTTTSATTSHHTPNSTAHIRQPQMIGLTSDKCESILNYFLVVWFLAGCIVVYRIYEPDYENPLSVSYCNRTVYLYAFWLMTSAFIIMAIVLSCLCCLMASSLMSCSHGR